jgi:hypothetical protein
MHATVSAHLTLFRADYTVNKEYELCSSSLFISLYEDNNAQEKNIYISFHRSLGFSMIFIARRTQV